MADQTTTDIRLDRRAAQGARTRISGAMAGVIAATATTLGSFGLVVSGIWLINLAVS